MLASRYGVPHLKKGGSIVLVSSIGYHTLTGLIQYDATKAALEGLMRNVGAVLAPHGSRINILRIGIADSPMGRAANYRSPARMGINIPLEKRLGTPWEQAYYGLFLLSDDSSYGGLIDAVEEIGLNNMPLNSHWTSSQLRRRRDSFAKCLLALDR